jgi:hypothetical protein
MNKRNDFKRDDVVSFKLEGLPLKVQALHDIKGLLWIEAADSRGNRTWGTQESFHRFADPKAKKPS